MSLRVKRYESVRALPAHWRELYRQSEPRLQFDQTLTWFEVFESHALADSERVELCCVEDDAQRPVLCMPLKRTSRRAHSLSSYYTSLFAPLSAPGCDDPAAVSAAVRAGASGCDVLCLEPLAAEDDVTASLESALSGGGRVAQRYFKFGNWYLDVASRSFDEYFRGLPSQLRNTVTRKEKKLRSEPGASVDIVTDVERLPAAIAAYEEVYASSWKTAEPHPRFVPQLMQAMASRGWLRLGVVRLGEEAIAAQIWIIKDGVASIFKLAYKEQHAKLSAGSILTTALMRHAIDVDRVSVVDYLTGDDSYKRDWMSHRRERIGLIAADWRSWGGLAFAARHILPGTVRRRLRGSTSAE